MRARRIKASKGYHYRGKTPSLKNRCMVHWESLLERDEVRLLEFDPYVLLYEFQPLVIEYTYGSKRYKYYPDFKVFTRDGRTILLEVKPSKFVSAPKNQVKFHAGQLYCQQMGWEFLVVTERDIRVGYLQENLDILLDLYGYQSPIHVQDMVVEVLQVVGPCSLHDIYSRINAIPQDILCRTIYTMIYTQKVKTDLIDVKLSDYSVVHLIN